MEDNISSLSKTDLDLIGLYFAPSSDEAEKTTLIYLISDRFSRRKIETLISNWPYGIESFNAFFDKLMADYHAKAMTAKDSQKMKRNYEQLIGIVDVARERILASGEERTEIIDNCKYDYDSLVEALDNLEAENAVLKAQLEDPWHKAVSHDNVVEYIATKHDDSTIDTLISMMQALLPISMHKDFYQDAEAARNKSYKPHAVKEPCPVESNLSSFAKYVADPSQAEYTLKWLHSIIDVAITPKDKIKPIRGLIEVGVLTDYIPYKEYVNEFGFMPKTTYSQWMKENAKYKEVELKNIIKTYQP